MPTYNFPEAQIVGDHAMTTIDRGALVIADQGAGKSNQMRSVFEEAELHGAYGGYPKCANTLLPLQGIQRPAAEIGWQKSDRMLSEVRGDRLGS